MLEKEYKKVSCNTLTELTLILEVNIGSYFYSPVIRKIKGEQRLEKIIGILEEKGEDYMLNK